LRVEAQMGKVSCQHEKRTAGFSLKGRCHCIQDQDSGARRLRPPSAPKELTSCNIEFRVQVAGPQGGPISSCGFIELFRGLRFRVQALACCLRTLACQAYGGCSLGPRQVKKVAEGSYLRRLRLIRLFQRARAAPELGLAIRARNKMGEKFDL